MVLYFKPNYGTTINTIFITANIKLVIIIWSFIFLMIFQIKDRKIHKDLLNEIAQIDEKIQYKLKFSSAKKSEKLKNNLNFILVALYAFSLLMAGNERFKKGVCDIITYCFVTFVLATFALVVLHIQICCGQLKQRFSDIRWDTKRRYGQMNNKQINLLFEFIEHFGQLTRKFEKYFGTIIFLNVFLDFAIFTVTSFLLVQNAIYKNESIFRFNKYIRITTFMAFVVPPLVKCFALAMALDNLRKEVNI